MRISSRESCAGQSEVTVFGGALWREGFGELHVDESLVSVLMARFGEKVALRCCVLARAKSQCSGDSRYRFLGVVCRRVMGAKSQCFGGSL